MAPSFCPELFNSNALNQETENRVIKPLEPNAFCTNEVRNSRYTLFNFVPKNLYEQFHRPLNLYFLLVACLQFISIIAPVSPFSTLVPLLIAFSVTAVKEGYDDLKRHRSDDEYNTRPVTALRCKQPAGAPPGSAPAGPPEWTQVHSSDIRVGDVIQVRHDQEIPCDCVCIAGPSDEVTQPGGSIYIRTENLDGEMDLKSRDVIDTSLTTDNSSAAAVKEACARFTLNYPPPSASFTEFDANFFVGQEARSMFSNHLLLQSSYLKNVHCIYAVVVFTGNETRCGMNKKPAAQKWAALDQCVSRYSILIFICQMITAFSMGLSGFLKNRDDTTWYLALQKGSSSEREAGGIIYPLRFFLLTSVMIPISFKFIVDVSKYWMALVLEWDLTMWSEERGEGMRVKNSSIVEDLAQIQYVLSDKTGTLTQNIMSLHSWTTGADTLYKMSTTSPRGAEPRTSSGNIGAAAGNNNNSSSSGDAVKTPGSVSSFRARLPSQREDRESLIELLVAMAICNTVTVHENAAMSPSGGPAQQRYSSLSPDEESLCAGAAQQGVVLETRTKSEMTISIEHTATSRTYEILHVFEFSSDRKCMSIVLRCTNNTAGGGDGTNNNNGEKGTIWLYSKGADDRMLGNLTDEARGSDRVSQCNVDITHFAHSGLRTLMFGRRRISPEELAHFSGEYEAARTLLSGRQEKIAEVQAAFERGVSFLGASGVEDKLQDDVQGTVRRIIDGNVKFWMLTGDKVETAKQIAVSCGLFTPSVIASNSPNCINITGADAIQTLENLNPRDVQLPAGFEDAQRAAVVRLHPLGWCSTACDPNGDGSGLPLLAGAGRPPTLIQTGSGRLEPYGASGSSSRGGGMETGMHLVVEGGRILDRILENPILSERLFVIASRCVAVVCARVTPGQKAAIANKVKELGNMTLSIGDGGNDVAMIQESHVGVGILGREGQQAARAADFAIVNFRDLATLMFVHGHMSYMRTSYIVLYSFYKSMLISAIQILYNIFCAKLSGVSFWNSFSLTMWNGAFTLPQTICFVLDQCVPREVLVRYPILYRLSQNNYGFTPGRFSSWLFMGMLQSASLLLFVWLGFGESSVADPSTGTGSSLGTDFTAAYTALLLMQIPLLCIYSNFITAINAFWIFLMPAGYAAMMAVYSLIKNLDYYKVWFHAEITPYVAWVFIVAVLLALPPLIMGTLNEMLAPDASRLLRRMWVSGGEFCSSQGKNCQLSDIRTASRPALASTSQFADDDGL